MWKPTEFLIFNLVRFEVLYYIPSNSIYKQILIF
jgi:hypothetical protein